MIDTAHIHPMIVHFPIAIIITGFIFDTLYYFYRSQSWLPKAGFWLMMFGTVAACATYLTGVLFTSEPTEGKVVHIYILHKTGCYITVLIMLLLSILRTRRAVKQKELRLNGFLYGLYAAGTAAVSFTGYMGGTMVYSYFLGI